MIRFCTQLEFYDMYKLICRESQGLLRNPQNLCHLKTEELHWTLVWKTATLCKWLESLNFVLFVVENVAGFLTLYFILSHKNKKKTVGPQKKPSLGFFFCFVKKLGLRDVNWRCYWAHWAETIYDHTVLQFHFKFCLPNRISKKTFHSMRVFSSFYNLLQFRIAYQFFMAFIEL